MNMLDQPEVEVEHEPAGRRGSRGLRWGALALAGLLLLVVAAAVLRRSSAPAPTTPAPAPAPAPSSAPVEPARGATAVDAGVPVGYPRTQQGAVAAATNYLVAFTQPRMFQPAVRTRVLTVLAGQDQAPQLIAAVDPGMQRAAQALSIDPGTGTSSMGQVVSQLIPAGYRVVSYGADRARVAVWATSLSGVAGASSSMPVSTTWATDTIDLTWDEGDWKWSGFVESDGPTPVGTVNPPSSWSDISGAVSDFTPYGYGSDQ